MGLLINSDIMNFNLIGDLVPEKAKSTTFFLAEFKSNEK